MTTAHRPTWNAAAGATGGIGQGGYLTGGQVSRAYSSKDLPGQLTMKTRQFGQGTESELSMKDLKADLEKRERQHFEAKRREAAAAAGVAVLEDSALRAIANGETGSGGGLETKEDEDIMAAVADFDDSDADDSESSDSSSSDDDDEEEEAKLMRELEKIKKEREEERARKAAEEEALAAKARETAALTGNPLLASSTKSTTARVKRRWDDDVVFRNQARDEKRPRKRFINDAIRSDFHRKFLNKYIQ